MDTETRDLVLDTLFLKARTHNAWLQRPVSASLLRRLYELCSMAPTAMNGQPMRLVFLTSVQARQRLLPALAPRNVEKTLSAPVTAIVAYDSQFHDQLHKVWHNPAARDAFAADSALSAATAQRNGSIQGGFFILAARALGLDCGPMSGFDAARVDAEFFAGSSWRANFLCSLGHGDAARLLPRQPRLGFDEACALL